MKVSFAKANNNGSNGRNAFAKNLLAPISFYLKVDSSLGSDDEKPSERDHNAMVHEVCYDPANTDLQTCKIYLSPFDTGSVEQWLKFLTKLQLIITGNSLTTGLAKFNLTRLLLKGEALHHFNNKAQELETETNPHHKMCLNAVSEHIFPKNVLQMQKCYLRKVRLHASMTISTYFMHWHQINDYLAMFPPHGGAVQKLRDDKIIELIYDRLLSCMQGDLQCMNDFDINKTDLTSFREALECLELSYQLDKKLVNSKKSETLKKDKEKSKGKQSGKKRSNNTNESSPALAKKPCLLHGTCSHTTEECKVVKEQISHMKVMYEAQDLAEHAKKCKEWKSKKAPTHKEINELVAESVKKSIKEIFRCSCQNPQKAQLRGYQ